MSVFYKMNRTELTSEFKNEKLSCCSLVSKNQLRL